ncbi:MAG: paraquat-inducible protein A [Deltaproteobacteria bacterium]|nr:paraquat-inducible protein A [Deltaproteobacteria bacterium]
MTQLNTRATTKQSVPLIACHECDLLQREIALPPGRVARCGRCGAELYRSAHRSIDPTLAFTLAAFVFFIVANAYPIVGLQIKGILNEATLLGTVVALWGQGMHAVSALVFLTTFLVPAVQLAVMCHLLVALKLGQIPAGFTVIMRILQAIKPWGMVEVFMLGIFVALVKLTHFASVIPGAALWCFGTLTLLMAAAAATFDVRDVWERVDRNRRVGGAGMTGTAGTAAARGLLTCHVCGLVSRALPAGGDALCPRCSTPLHFRKPNSVSCSWALLIAAYIMYVPANLLPIMETGSLFGSQDDTIMSGIVYLWHSGSWDLALVVFIASMLVPLMKLIAITLLLVTVQRRSTWLPVQRTRLYRLVELVGRWSMLDIYVVTILAALVQIGSLATIKAGPAAIPFGAVVVLTMFAAMQFDPRLIWDPFQKERPEHDRHEP